MSLTSKNIRLASNDKFKLFILKPVSQAIMLQTFHFLSLFYFNIDQKDKMKAPNHQLTMPQSYKMNSKLINLKCELLAYQVDQNLWFKIVV